MKSQIGHTKAAAGAAGLIKAALALYHKVLPPTLKVEQPAKALTPGSTPFYLNTVKRPWLPRPDHPRRAGVSAFGFGGSNFHCVLEEHRPEMPGVDWDGSVQIVALSSGSADGIESLLSEWERVPTADVAAKAAESCRSFRSNQEWRLLLVVAKDTSDLPKLASSARRLLDGIGSTAFAHSPDGVFLGRGPAAGKLAMLFPGQGSQYVGMLRDLACKFPQMHQSLIEADRGFLPQGGRRLSDFIYPQPAFSAEAKAEQERELRTTQVAQPAIGAVSLGALRVLQAFGVEPGATAGHSYGELTALCAAGCFDAEALHQLSRTRGRLMADAANGDAGAMLAVHSNSISLERAITEESLHVVVANRNSPTQTVLSGATAEIERTAQALEKRRIRTTGLPVAAAFHSPLVADAAKPFRAALDSVRVQAAGLPVFANSTAGRYPDDPEQVRSLLAGQLAKPVEFVREVEAMLAAGVRTFVEVGPGQTLTRLVDAILKESDAGKSADAFALDSSAGKRSGTHDLATTLARLAARGHSLRLTAWEADPPHAVSTSPKSGLTVPICGANYVKPRPQLPPTMATRSESAPLVAQKLDVVPSKLSASPARTAAVPEPPQRAASPNALSQVLQLSQDSLSAFQKLQEQTAQLHRQFLQGQEAAQQALARLVEQQQQVALASLGMGAAAAISPPAVVLPELPPAAPVPAPVPVAAAPPPAPPTASGDSSRTQRVLLDVVAEKTGYPAEMLDLDMGLDADLGIDSIKRVEILSALQEKLPDAPAVKPENLGTLNTLRQIVAFLANGSPNGHSAPPPASLPKPTANVERILLEVVAEKTGYPVEMLDPNMGLDADLGIDSIKRVEILSALQERLPEAPIVKPEHVLMVISLCMLLV
ncbi:MAG: acyltransferase domain-containing protein, partial [Gemmataceae bacterium]